MNKMTLATYYLYIKIKDPQPSTKKWVFAKQHYFNIDR